MSSETIECTTSANSTVTCLYSADVAPGMIGAPHLLQNRAEPKAVKNRVHRDLATRSAEHQASLVQRVRDLGARPLDIGQGDMPWVVLADPEGNEFCVLTPR